MAMLVSRFRGRGMQRNMALCAAALLLCYACGTWQFVRISGNGVASALAICVLPFLPFDLVKLTFACIIGTKIRGRLQTMRLL